MSQAVDLYIVYEFIKRLSTPFEETKAYQLGIINDEGKVIKKPRSREEKDALTPFDKLVFNLKKLLKKVTGIERRLATFSAALFLLKESQKENRKSFISESEFVYFTFDNKSLVETILEDIPTNAVGTGNIAGVDNPGVVKKVLQKHREKNKKQANNVSNMSRQTFSAIRLSQ
jgi:hypothetical protein